MPYLDKRSGRYFWGQVDLRAKGGGCPKMSFDRWDDAQAFEDRVATLGPVEALRQSPPSWPTTSSPRVTREAPHALAIASARSRRRLGLLAVPRASGSPAATSPACAGSIGSSTASTTSPWQ
jgi:hypothetical protein